MKYDLHSVPVPHGAAPASNVSTAYCAESGRDDNKLAMVVAEDQFAAEAKNAMDDCETRLLQSAIELEALGAGIASFCQVDWMTCRA